MVFVKFDDFLLGHIRYSISILIPRHITYADSYWNEKHNPTTIQAIHQNSKPFFTIENPRKNEYIHNNKNTYPYKQKKIHDFFYSFSFYISFIHEDVQLIMSFSYLFFIYCQPKCNNPDVTTLNVTEPFYGM